MAGDAGAPTAMLALTGDVDAAVSDALTLDAQALLRPGVSGLVVDLGQVQFMDSSGIALLVAIHRNCAERGIELRLRRVPHRVAVLMELSGVTDLFETVDGLP